MRERIRIMLEAGVPISQIAAELGVTPPAVCYHARKLGFPAQPRSKYDWTAIQAYYDDGHTYAETKARFGFSNGAWAKAIEAGKIVSPEREGARDVDHCWRHNRKAVCWGRV